MGQLGGFFENRGGSCIFSATETSNCTRRSNNHNDGKVSRSIHSQCGENRAPWTVLQMDNIFNLSSALDYRKVCIPTRFETKLRMHFWMLFDNIGSQKVLVYNPDSRVFPSLPPSFFPTFTPFNSSSLPLFLRHFLSRSHLLPVTLFIRPSIHPSMIHLSFINHQKQTHSLFLIPCLSLLSSQKIPNLDEVFADINTTVSDTSVMTNQAKKSVNDSFDAGVQNINFTEYTQQVGGNREGNERDGARPQSYYHVYEKRTKLSTNQRARFSIII